MQEVFTCAVALALRRSYVIIMILDEILEARKIQLAEEKKNYLCGLKLKDVLQREKLTIIAEVKKASPSKSAIVDDFDPVQIATEYEQAGAAAISVLTEEKYFQGSGKYISQIREAVDVPILRKDFIFEEFQVAESKFLGANAILLIAAMLPEMRLGELYYFARGFHLDCIVEVHNEEDLKKIWHFEPEIVGVNNRDLNSFNVDLSVSEQLIPIIRRKLRGVTVVAESGMTCSADLKRMYDVGADAVLMGETLMRSKQNGKTVAKTFEELTCS